VRNAFSSGTHTVGGYSAAFRTGIFRLARFFDLNGISE
jgi:hypothetical protein